MLAQLGRMLENWVSGLSWEPVPIGKDALVYKGQRVGYICTQPVYLSPGRFATKYYYQAYVGDQILLKADETFEDGQQYFDESPLETCQRKVEEAVRAHFNLPSLTKIVSK